MQARRYRKVLGVGMHRAEVITAAGVVALETMTTRLAKEHANVRHLAQGLSARPGIELAPDKVRTNTV